MTSFRHPVLLSPYSTCLGSRRIYSYTNAYAFLTNPQSRTRSLHGVDIILQVHAIVASTPSSRSDPAGASLAAPHRVRLILGEVSDTKGCVIEVEVGW